MREPRAHQIAALAKTAELPAAALFMEQRTGKTLVAVKTAALHAESGKIDGALVIGWPNGVQFIWEEEWAKDWPAERPYRFITWRSGKMNSTENTKILSETLTAPEFVVVALNCEAMLTEIAWKFISKFIARRRLIVIADEDFAKSPGSARSKRLHAIGRHPNAVYRRFLSGTPAAEGSMDLWSPGVFLDWRLLGHKSFFTYRNRYCVMVDGYGTGGRRFATPLKNADGGIVYQNLVELREKLDKFSFRVRRADVSDAPAKTYVSRYFELTSKQRRVYDRIEGEFEAELTRGSVPIPLQITRLLRLQMVSRGYYPPETIGESCSCVEQAAFENPNDDCPRCQGFGVIPINTRLERIDERNPALEALIAEINANPGPLVVWCRFRQDVLDVLDVALSLGRRPARYDGSVPTSDRESAYQDFRDGIVDILVATSSSGLSRGHDCSRAEAMIYYSNSYVLRDRLQSEDRAESLSRTTSTGIIDLIGVNTRDGPIVAALRAKRSIAAYLQGDPEEKAF